MAQYNEYGGYVISGKPSIAHDVSSDDVRYIRKIKAEVSRKDSNNVIKSGGSNRNINYQKKCLKATNEERF